MNNKIETLCKNLNEAFMQYSVSDEIQNLVADLLHEIILECARVADESVEFSTIPSQKIENHFGI